LQLNRIDYASGGRDRSLVEVAYNIASTEVVGEEDAFRESR
jgi:hypothetical protein